MQALRTSAETAANDVPGMAISMRMTKVASFMAFPFASVISSSEVKSSMDYAGWPTQG